MDNHTKRGFNRLCGVVLVTALLIIIPSVLFDFYYDLNDDTAIKDIISGTYTGIPSGYCIQMLYPLSFILAVCYRAIPAIPWYGLFLCVCQYAVFALIADRLIRLMKNKIQMVIALAFEVLIVLGLCFRQVVIIQYSVTSGICMTGAIFLFITEDMTDKVGEFLKKNIVPAFLVVLSFMIRTEVCIMLLPFLLFAGLCKWGNEKKIFTSINFRKYLLLIGSVLIVMLAALSLDKLAYGDSDWTGFRKYFDARTKVYDFYELPSYSQNKEFYDSIGLSQESFTLLENYNFALDDSIDTWVLESIAEYQKKMAKNGQSDTLKSTFGYVSKNSFDEALWLYKKMIKDKFDNILQLASGRAKETDFTLQIALEYAVIVAYAILISMEIFSGTGISLLNRLKKKKEDDFEEAEINKERLKNGIKIAGLFVIRSILWLYLLMVDRVLERVTIPLLLAELSVLIAFMLSSRLKDRFASGKMLKVIICTMCVLYLLVVGEKGMNALRNEFDARSKADLRWNTLMEYCQNNSEYFFVIDVYSSTSYNGAFYSEKIFKNVDNSYRNFDICGGWVAKSPVARQKLQKYGIKELQKALTEGKCRFIAASDRDMEWIESYYFKRNIPVKVDCISTINTDDGEEAFKVYCVERINRNIG